MSAKTAAALAVGIAWSGGAQAATDGGGNWMFALLLVITLAGLVLAFRLRSVSDRVWKREAELVVTRGQLSELEKVLDARDDSLEREIFQRTRSLESANQRLSRERDELESSNTRLKRLVDLDPVTGLANRDAFASLVDSELRRSLREGRPVSVIAFGVDHFRELNRANGHDAADTALRTLGGVLAEVFRRAGDATGRLGSDRLGIVVPGAAHDAGLRLAEKVRAQAHKLAMPHDAAPGADRVTVSAGCMTVEPRTRTDAETALATAEAALGVAQRQGGNRVLSDLLPRKGKPSLRSVSGSSQ